MYWACIVHISPNTTFFQSPTLLEWSIKLCLHHSVTFLVQTHKAFHISAKNCKVSFFTVIAYSMLPLAVLTYFFFFDKRLRSTELMEEFIWGLCLQGLRIFYHYGGEVWQPARIAIGQSSWNLTSYTTRKKQRGELVVSWSFGNPVIDFL